ncbi:MAG: hypothetical protein AAGI49_14755 [Bacteroidota bacterium]
MKNRYPGIRAFEYAERDLFFGRKDDIKKLYTSIKAQELVVLFAKSGIGKSSLINAGLIPLLESDLYQAIKIRLQDPTLAPLEVVKAGLSAYLDEDLLQKHTGKNKETAGLWSYIKACTFPQREGNATPVLIFDQFEEFFEHSEANQFDLISGIADLLGERLPTEIQANLRKIPFAKRTTADLDWHSPVEVKVIFAIRSDRLSLLDRLSDEIPMILSNRYHLQPLQRKQAVEAITQPALLEGDFSTAPFKYQADTLERMLDYLSNKDQEIESFQLQLICQHIEKEVKMRAGETLD